MLMAAPDMGGGPPPRCRTLINYLGISVAFKKDSFQDPRPGGAGLFLEVLINNLTSYNDNFILLQFVDL